MPPVDTGIRPDPNVPLAPLGTFGVGGPAQWFVRAHTPAQVAGAHRWAREEGLDLFVLGGGSNLVIADAGIEGLVLQIALPGTDFIPDGGDTLVRVGAGEPWDGVVAATTVRGLAGLECLSGIPGSVGGTPVQNVGAYGQEVGDSIEAVHVFDRSTGAFATLTREECRFSYRGSRFKGADRSRFVVCDVTFRLRQGAPTASYPDLVAELERRGVRDPGVAGVRAAVLTVRRRKGMVLDPQDTDTRSVGSFFLNPVVRADEHRRLMREAGGRVPGFTLAGGDVKIPAAWLIERAGFSKGDSDGCVGLSSKHPLAIVNRGGATARDVIRLARRIKKQVADRCGIWLIPEPTFVGVGDDPDVAYLLRAHD